MAFASERGNKLVHDAARHPGEIMFGLLREQDFFNGVNVPASRGFNQSGCANFKRGAAAQAAAQRHGGHEGDIERGNFPVSYTHLDVYKRQL